MSTLLKSRDKLLLFIALLFISSVLFRFSISFLSATPVFHPDELLYLKTSYSLATDFNTNFRNSSFLSDNILYQLLISIAYFFGDNFYQVMKLLNCIVMSACIFPVYFLCREITKNVKLSLIIGILSIVLPDMFHTMLIMQDSLFFLIFLTTYYFIYKEINENFISGKLSIKWTLLLGVFFFLCYFTKAVGLFLLISYFLFVIIDYLIIKRYEFVLLIKRLTLVFGTFLILIFINKFFVNLINGFPEINSQYSSFFELNLNTEKLEKGFLGLLIYAYYTIKAFAIFPVIFVLSYISRKNNITNKLGLFSAICMFVFVSLIVGLIFVNETHNIFESRIFMRYWFVLFLPFLILALNLILTERKNILNKKFYIFFSIFILLAILIENKYKIMTYPLFTDAPMLAYYKIFDKFPFAEYLTYILFVFYLSFILYDSLQGNFNKVAKAMMSFIFIVSIINNIILYKVYIDFYNNSSVYGSHELREEITSIRSFLKNNNSTALLLPAEYYGYKDSFSIISLEALLDVNYHFISFEQAINENFTDGNFNLRGYLPEAYIYGDISKKPIDKVDYLITTVRNVQFSGVEQIHVPGVNKYYKIFKVNESSFKVSTIISNIYDDKWNDGEVALKIFSQKDILDVSFELDSSGNPNKTEISIKDETGQVKTEVLSNTTTTIKFNAKKMDEKPYFLIYLSSNDFFIPREINPQLTDTRKISFRLINYKINNE